MSLESVALGLIRPLWVQKLFVGELGSVCSPSIPNGLSGPISAGLVSIQRERNDCAHSAGMRAKVT